MTKTLHCRIVPALLPFFCLLSSLLAQTGEVQQSVRPWVTFEDPVTGATCERVHAENVDLVLLQETSQLIILNEGPDVTLSDTLVDVEGNVLFEGLPVGIIGFHRDGDGKQSVWWTGLTGEVVTLADFTGQPSPTNRRPAEFRNLSCDACPFWDDPQLCIEPMPVEPEPVTVQICGQSVMFPLMLMSFGLGLMRFGGRRMTRQTVH